MAQEPKAVKAAAPAQPVKGLRIFEPEEGTLRWIHPIPEVPFRVQVRFLSDEDQAMIFDRHKIVPGGNKNTMTKYNAAAADVIDAKVVAWEFPGSVFIGEPDSFPCSGMNKQRLQGVFIKRDGEDEAISLWRLIVQAEEKALEDERKN